MAGVVYVRAVPARVPRTVIVLVADVTRVFVVVRRGAVRSVIHRLPVERIARYRRVPGVVMRVVIVLSVGVVTGMIGHGALLKLARAGV